MFWRKKDQGFDWNKYVPTTLLIRRKVRRDRLEDAGRAAVGHAQAAGQAAMVGAQKGAVVTAGGLSWLLQSIGTGIIAMLRPLGRLLAQGGHALMSPFKRLDPAGSLSGPLALIGSVTLASGGYRWATVGLDQQTLVPLLVGVLLFVPMLLAHVSAKPGGIARALTGFDKRLVFGSIGLVTIIGAALTAAHVMTPGGKVGGTLAALTNINFLPGSTPPIESRNAVVLGADTFRLDGKIVRLSGIDTPDRGQLCASAGSGTGSGKKRGKCADVAQSALERIVRGKLVVCRPGGTADATGRIAAACTVDGRDVAADLVKAGQVFSQSTYFGGYAIEESEARLAKVGVWSGDAERPSDYRAKLWDAAKATSPNGCPIKGTVTSNGKVYLAPWSSDYTKVSVRSSRGERWFCSEEEARLAGWKAADRG